MQLAARQSGLQKVGRVHRAIGFASANQRVHFINEQDDLAFGRLYFIEHAFQTLFKFAAIFGASNQRPHVERHQGAVFQRVGHIAIGNAQRQTFGNCRFANAGFANQHWVILGPAGENLDVAANFLIATNNGVQLAVMGSLGQIAGELLQRVISVLGRGRIGGLALAQFVNRSIQRLSLEARFGQRLASLSRARQGERQQQPFYRNKAIACFCGNLFGLIEHADRIFIKARRLVRAGTGNSRDARQGGICLAHGGRSIRA